MKRKLKSLKLLISLKSPNSLKSQNSLKKLNAIKFDKTKTAKAASSVVLFGFSGWFLWHTFLAVPEPTLPPSLPQAVATISPAPIVQNLIPVDEPIETAEQLTVTDADEMINELLVVTGWHKQADNFPDQILQSSNKTNDLVIQAEIEQMVTKAFEPTLFKQHMHASLKNNFDQARAARLLQSYHQPWLQKITQLESQEVQPTALQTYIEGLTGTSLSEKRIQLFQRYDSTVQLTEFKAELSSGMMRTMLNGVVENDDPTMAKFDTELDQNSHDLHENMHSNLLNLLAYIYRELNDDEFEAYVKFLTSDDGMWLNATLMPAVLEKLNASALQISQQLAALCKTSKPCANDSSPETTPVAETLKADSAPSEAHQYALTARSKLDARECLNLTDNMAIHRCTENYR